MIWFFIGLIALAAILAFLFQSRGDGCEIERMLWCMSDGGKQSAELHIVVDPAMEKDRALLVASDCFDEQGDLIPEKIALITNIGEETDVP